MKRIESKALESMVIPLLKWYSIYARDLPWRRNKSPYHIWISEIILQQTRVEAGKRYYERLIEELPNVSALALVNDQKLMKLWEGLGYYSRARNLKKAAQQIMNEYQGVIPDTYEGLCSLPGVGPYTAGAIASIAYEKPVAAVDGNVLRVMARYLTLQESISKPMVKKEITESIMQILPLGHIGDFNQALMELGALVCIPNGLPKCIDCPLRTNCKAYKQNLMMQYPIKDNKKKRKIADQTVLIIRYEDSLVLEKRENTGLLAGLWGLPILEGKILKEDIPKLWNQWNSVSIKIIKEKKIKHVFTHIEWHMIGYYIYLEKPLDHEGWSYITLHDIVESYAIPSAFKAFLGKHEL